MKELSSVIRDNLATPLDYCLIAAAAADTSDQEDVMFHLLTSLTQGPGKCLLLTSADLGGAAVAAAAAITIAVHVFYT